MREPLQCASRTGSTSYPSNSPKRACSPSCLEEFFSETHKAIMAASQWSSPKLSIKLLSIKVQQELLLEPRPLLLRLAKKVALPHPLPPPLVLQRSPG